MVPPEPIASTTALFGVLALAIISMLPGVDASVVLGAFSGSIVFVLSSDELGTVKKIGFLVASFLAGVLTAPMAAALLSALLPGSISVSPGVGALLSATIAVKTLLWLLERNLAEIIALVRGVRPPE